MKRMRNTRGNTKVREGGGGGALWNWSGYPLKFMEDTTLACIGEGAVGCDLKECGPYRARAGTGVSWRTEAHGDSSCQSRGTV